MPSPFLSSEEYDERAHQLYSEGQYDEALDVLREGLALYPNSVELHVGVGYARLAREEYAWARQSFEKALVLDPEHEDAIAGLAETQLKLGQTALGLANFRRLLSLGYSDDVDLMLQVGRALFQKGLMDDAREFFDIAAREAPEAAEPHACQGYTAYQMGNDELAIAHLERALELDEEHTEARIFLAKVLYARGDQEGALLHLEQTTPADHWDENDIWSVIELKKSQYGLGEDDPELRPWEERLAELSGEPDDIDEMLAEIEQRFAASENTEPSERNQFELLGTLLGSLAEHRQGASDARRTGEQEQHCITLDDGRQLVGSWEEIVQRMRDANQAFAGRSLQEFMATEARRVFYEKRLRIPAGDAESFIRGSASAGLLRIVR
ncbi:MAG TPA: tetratricopeptide repeat protein [Gemmatimonadaceae bacterium]|nr:tetratricopeptide repeat protein [Gemmatimonadaceae bacterium]